MILFWKILLFFMFRSFQALVALTGVRLLSVVRSVHIWVFRKVLKAALFLLGLWLMFPTASSPLFVLLKSWLELIMLVCAVLLLMFITNMLLFSVLMKPWQGSCVGAMFRLGKTGYFSTMLCVSVLLFFHDDVGQHPRVIRLIW